MPLDVTKLPDDVATLKVMLVAAEARIDNRDAEITNLKRTIARMQRDQFGARSERGVRLLDQLELQLAELEASVAQDKAAVEITQRPNISSPVARLRPNSPPCSGQISIKPAETPTAPSAISFIDACPTHACVRLTLYGAFIVKTFCRAVISGRQMTIRGGARIRAITARKDYRRNGPERYTTMTLGPHEFIRRFLIHVLPKGLHRIRHYGLFANSNRADNLTKMRELLGMKADDDVGSDNTANDEPDTLPHPPPLAGIRNATV